MIQPGERVVRGPIVWDKAKITELGHYCFICYLTDAGQHFPDPMDMQFRTAQEYEMFVAAHSNMCFHNVNIVDQWDVDHSFRSFIMVGMPEVQSPIYRLTLSTDLPKDTPIKIDVGDWSDDVRAKPGPVLVNDDIKLPRGEKVRVTFQVEPIEAGDYDLRFSQYSGKDHLGSVSFKLHY